MDAEKAWVRIFGTPFDFDNYECRWFQYGYNERVEEDKESNA